MTKEQDLQQQLDECRKAKNALLDRVNVLPKLTKERDALWSDVSAYLKAAVETLARGEAKVTWRDDLSKIISEKIKEHTLGGLWELLDRL